MSELWGQDGTAAFAGQPAANDAVTAGALLRRGREAAGLHVAALAVALKVPVRKLEALEEDRWDMLPDAVFVRALASSVCRTLKIDPQPVLDRLPQRSAPRLIQSDEGINTPFRAPSDGDTPSWLHQLSRPVFLSVFALLLGALVLILLPSAQRDGAVAAVVGSAPPVSTPDTVAHSAPAAEPGVTTVSVTNAAQAPAAAPSAPMAAASATGVPAATAPSTAPAPAAVLVAAPTLPVKPIAAASAAKPAASSAGVDTANTVADAPAAAASGIIVFRTKGSSWVEVTDAKGVVAVRRLLLAGEAAGASGALPLQVIIGRVDATEVQVRGKPFDLRRVSRDNVARFEVK